MGQENKPGGGQSIVRAQEGRQGQGRRWPSQALNVGSGTGQEGEPNAEVIASELGPGRGCSCQHTASLPAAPGPHGRLSRVLPLPGTHTGHHPNSAPTPGQTPVHSITRLSRTIMHLRVTRTCTLRGERQGPGWRLVHASWPAAPSAIPPKESEQGLRTLTWSHCPDTAPLRAASIMPPLPPSPPFPLTMAAHVGGGRPLSDAAGRMHPRGYRHGADYGLQILLLFQAAGVPSGTGLAGGVGGKGPGRGKRQGEGAGAAGR